jgi:iron complex transport system ATP-binding protein
MKPSDDALVTVEDLSVTLGGKAILQHLHTRIPRGQITALIGLNGSGKTTFLRAILGEVPYTGRVVFSLRPQSSLQASGKDRLRSATVAF